MAPTTWLQKFGVKRPRERFKISDVTRITADQAIQLIQDLRDENPDFPNVADLMAVLRNMEKGQTLGREEMKDYLGR
jgi:hypothetical protein